MVAVPDRFVAGRSLAAACRNPQDVGVAAVGVERTGEDAVRGIRAVVPEQRATRAVAEEDAGVAVGPVHDHGELIGSADQHVAVFLREGTHEGESDFKTGDESGARGGKVEAERLFALEMVLHQRAGVRKDVVGGNRGDHDRIDVASVDSGLRQGFFRGLDRHGGRGFVGSGDAPFFDACTRANPLVVGVDQFFEIGVGPFFFREVRARPRNANAHIVIL